VFGFAGMSSLFCFLLPGFLTGCLFPRSELLLCRLYGSAILATFPLFRNGLGVFSPTRCLDLPYLRLAVAPVASSLSVMIFRPLTTVGPTWLRVISMAYAFFPLFRMSSGFLRLPIFLRAPHVWFRSFLVETRLCYPRVFGVSF